MKEMINDEKCYIRRFTKVFNEGKDEYWWLDMGKYIKLASKYDLDGKKLRIAVECSEEDESKTIVSAKTIDRVRGYIYGEKEGAGDKSVTIETIKALGKALCDGDEYGLLIKIEPSNVKTIMKEGEEIWHTSDINYIYGLMNTLLYELVISSYYSYRPGTEEDGFEYYDMRLQKIRNEIDRHFWNKDEIRNKLYRLVEEEEELIKSYSQPGAPERWVKANPKLRFYDCVFDFMEESPHIYELIKTGALKTKWGRVMSFNFYPTEKECKERKAYFAKLAAKNSKQNSQYTYDRFYQNELVDAFRIVFEKDFM